MEIFSESVISACLGLGLSAATGFRVFVPLLLINLASRGGWLNLAESFSWMGSNTALAVFGVATILEVAAYYVPWLDNILDSVATPAAVVAGTVATASVVTGMDPMMKWGLAIIAGGGAAGAIQSTFVGARQISALTTAGLGNPIVSTFELLGSIFMSVISFLAPILAGVAVATLLWIATRRFVRRDSARDRFA